MAQPIHVSLPVHDLRRSPACSAPRAAGQR